LVWRQNDLRQAMRPPAERKPGLATED